MSRHIGLRRSLLLANLALAGTVIFAACGSAAATQPSTAQPRAVVHDPDNPAFIGRGIDAAPAALDPANLDAAGSSRPRQ